MVSWDASLFPKSSHDFIHSTNELPPQRHRVHRERTETTKKKKIIKFLRLEIYPGFLYARLPHGGHRRRGL